MFLNSMAMEGSSYILFAIEKEEMEQLKPKQRECQERKRSLAISSWKKRRQKETQACHME